MKRSDSKRGEWLPIPTQKKILNRQSAKEKVYTELKNWIITGIVKPGEKLLDADIAEYFSVSRTPVREALQLLQTQKLVKVSPGRSTVVSDIETDQFRSWYQTLALLQGFAAELACAHVTESDLQELETMNDKYRHALAHEEISAVIDADAKLHGIILRMSGYEILREFSNSLMLHIERVEYLYFAWVKAHSQSSQTHQEIIDSLRAGDRDRARECMKRNWLTSMEVYEQKLCEPAQKVVS